MGCNGRDRFRNRNNHLRNIRLLKQNLENLPAERFGIPSSELTIRPSDLHLGIDTINHSNGDQNRNPNPDFDETGWGYCTEDQLQVLLLKHLHCLYKEAVSKLVELGYDEEMALKAVLCNGHCFGSMDYLETILHSCLNYISGANENCGEHGSGFGSLRQLEEYSLATMVCLVQKMRPELSKGDAMWCLLMSELNVDRAGTMVIPMPNENANNNLNGIVPGTCKFHGGWGFSTGEGCDFSISGSFQSFEGSGVRDVECPERFNLTPSMKSMLQRNVTLFAAGFRANAKTAMTRSQSFGRSNGGVTLEQEVSSEKSEGFKVNTRTHVMRTFGNAVGVMLEPEDIPEKSKGFKKSTKTHVIRSIGGGMGVTLESEDPLEKSDRVKVSTKTRMIRSLARGGGVGVTLEAEDLLEKSEVSQTNPRRSAKPVAKRTPFTGKFVKIPLDTSEKSERPQESPSSDVVNSVMSSLGNLSLNEKVEGGAADQKNEIIMNLIHQIKDLEGQVKDRKEWAHQKAMQAARKLSQDLTELKMLKMEREETQRLKKGKQTLEDTTMKRLSEMENALRKASGQVDRANGAVRKLEIENAEIRAEMEASKLSASESVNTCLEVAKREKKCLKKLLAWEKQKSKLQEEVAEEKQKISQLQEQLVLIKGTQKQTEANWRQELKAKELAIAQVEEERRSKEAIEVGAKRKTETLRRKTELDFQRHKDDIQRLEQELSRLRSSMESTEINCRTYNVPAGHSDIVQAPKNANTRMLHELNHLQDSSDKEVDYDRECIICKKDEVSVVFLPCAHQVLCAKCSQDYGKKGKATCPCCRVQIEQRICVYGASS